MSLVTRRKIDVTRAAFIIVTTVGAIAHAAVATRLRSSSREAKPPCDFTELHWSSAAH